MKDTLEYYKCEWTKKNLELRLKKEGGITFSTEKRQQKKILLVRVIGGVFRSIIRVT